MDTQNTNNLAKQPNRPMLKKVKRPINRIAPQSPAVSQPAQAATPQIQSNAAPVQETFQERTDVPQQTGNPFKQQSVAKEPSAAFSEDVFNIDKLLDGNENLPTVKNTPSTYNQAPEFIDEEDGDEIYDDGAALPPFLS